MSSDTFKVKSNFTDHTARTPGEQNFSSAGLVFCPLSTVSYPWLQLPELFHCGQIMIIQLLLVFAATVLMQLCYLSWRFVWPANLNLLVSSSHPWAGPQSMKGLHAGAYTQRSHCVQGMGPSQLSWDDWTNLYILATFIVL